MEISDVFNLALASVCFWYVTILCIQALPLDVSKMIVYGSSTCLYACLAALYYFMPAIRDVSFVNYIIGVSSMIVLLIFYFRDVRSLLYVHLSGILYFAMTHTSSFVEAMILYSVRGDILKALGSNARFIYDLDFPTLMMIFSGINCFFLIIGAFRQGKHKFAIDVSSFQSKTLLLGGFFAVVSTIILLGYYQMIALPSLVTSALSVSIGLVQPLCMVGISLIIVLAYALLHQMSVTIADRATTSSPSKKITKLASLPPKITLPIQEKVDMILFQSIPHNEVHRYSEHDALDKLCYAYTKECQTVSIPLYTQITVDQQLYFDDRDLCVLLALCIELGLEGCEMLSKDTLHFINIYVKQNNDALEIIADYPPMVNVNQIFPRQNRMQQMMQIVKSYEGGMEFDNSKEYSSIFITMYATEDDMTGNFSDNLV